MVVVNAVVTFGECFRERFCEGFVHDLVNAFCQNALVNACVEFVKASGMLSECCCGCFVAIS